MTTLNFENCVNLRKFVDGVSTYIAGFVAKKVATKLHCDECKLSLTSSTHKNSLTDIKNYGYLTKPSTDVEKKNNVTEKIFKQYTYQTHSSNPHNFFFS